MIYCVIYFFIEELWCVCEFIEGYGCLVCYFEVDCGVVVLLFVVVDFELFCDIVVNFKLVFDGVLFW